MIKRALSEVSRLLTGLTTAYCYITILQWSMTKIDPLFEKISVALDEDIQMVDIRIIKITEYIRLKMFFNSVIV